MNSSKTEKLNVLIVDDEPVIREGIKTFIPWSRLNCVFAGEASDGMEAVEFIKRGKVDIVITDIRMPGMDGLELAEWVTENFPEIKVIILTGYSDFEYARKALRFNTVDYLLKPAGEEELTSVLKKTISEIQKDSTFKNILINNSEYLFEPVLKNLLSGTKESAEKSFRLLNRIGIPADEQSLFRVLIFFNIGNKDFSGFPECGYCIFSDIFEVPAVTGLIINKNKEKLTEYLRNFTAAGFAVFAGPEKNGFEGLLYSREKVLEAFSCYQYIDSAEIIFAGEQERLKNRFVNLLPPAAEPQETAERMKESFISYNPEAEKYPAALLHYCLNNQLQITDYVNICMSIFEDIIRTLEKEGIYNIPRFSERFSGLNKKGSTWKFTLSAVTEIFSDLGNYVRETAGKKYSSITLYAIEYVKSHFKENISLKNISEKTGLSESHISRIFKKDTGINFIPWVNKFRVEYSKELLADPELKMYEIADLAGFSGYKYFTRMFKQFTGITPGRYRKNLFS